MIRQLWRSLRYSHPFVLRGATTVAAVALSVILYTSVGAMRDSEFVTAIGLQPLFVKIEALRHALYWSSRAVMGTEGHEEPAHAFGVVAGVTPDGKQLVLTLYADGQITTRPARLADTVLINPARYVDEIVAIQHADAAFDFYRGGHDVVVWINRSPWNVHLISVGAMDADENPPTNIVHKAFAQYYWRIVRGDDL